MLCLYGMGTNAGLKRVVAGQDRVSYRDLLYTRRRFITPDHLRYAIGEIVNATLRARSPEIWGEGTTACTSDARYFGAWDQNLMTEWRARYGGPVVGIYWHVERHATCIHSHLKTCSSSEVAAMIQGVLRHCTEMEIDRQYVDSHGQSTVGLAFCRLLGFELLPRLKKPGPIERLVEWLGQQSPTLFMASGFCEDEQLVILGLSLANWAFLVFIGALAAGAWALWHGRHPTHS